MKRFNTYLTEKLHIGKDVKSREDIDNISNVLDVIDTIIEKCDLDHEAIDKKKIKSTILKNVWNKEVKTYAAKSDNMSSVSLNVLIPNVEIIELKEFNEMVYRHIFLKKDIIYSNKYPKGNYNEFKIFYKPIDKVIYIKTYCFDYLLYII